MFDNLPSSIDDIQSGALRALADATDTRSKALPRIPTVAETVPGYEASIWYGVVAPKGTPRDVVERLNKEINAILADSTMKQRLAELGCAPMPTTPNEFGSLLLAETEKWAKVVRFA